MTKRFCDQYGNYRDVDALSHMAQVARFLDNRCAQVFLTEPLKFENTEVYGRDRVQLGRMLLAVTEEELLELYRSLRAGMQRDLDRGTDFSTEDMRAVNPHLYKAQP